MSKRLSRRNIIFITVMVIIGILLSVCRFDIPFTDYTYNGFINSIPLGLDLQGGVSAVYEATLPLDDNSDDLDSAITATISRLESLLESNGYNESSVAKQGNNKIRVEVAKLTDTDELFELIGEPVELKITKEDKETAILTGKHVKNASVSMQNDDYGVVLTFTDEGSKLFAELTGEIAESEESIYIMINDEEISELTATGSITGGSTFISGDDMKNSYDASNEFAMKILSGSFTTELRLVENSNVSAVLGKNSLLLCTLAVFVVFLIFMIVLIMIYGQIGLMASLSMLIFAILYIFFLQSVPLVQLTISGFAGILLSIIVLFGTHSLYFEKIKEEYNLGKKIPMSFKSGYKKSIPVVVDSHVVVAIASFILYLVGSATAKSFAVANLIGVILSLFITLVVTRWLLNLYLPLNSTNAKKLKLKREANINEL